MMLHGHRLGNIVIDDVKGRKVFMLLCWSKDSLFQHRYRQINHSLFVLCYHFSNKWFNDPQTSELCNDVFSLSHLTRSWSWSLFGWHHNKRSWSCILFLTTKLNKLIVCFVLFLLILLPLHYCWCLLIASRGYYRKRKTWNKTKVLLMEYACFNEHSIPIT